MVLPMPNAQLTPDPLGTLLDRLRLVTAARAVPLRSPWPAVVLFFSLSDGHRRAEVVSATGSSFSEAWEMGVRAAKEAVAASQITVQWLRVDWVDEVEPMTWEILRGRLQQTKRNYFRSGLSLDREFRHAFLETELNANAMLYGGAAEPTATLNTKNFERYAALRHKLDRVDFAQEREVYRFSALGAFASLQEEGVHLLNAKGRNASRRVIEPLQPVDVRQLVASSSRYLATQVQPSGRFHYGWHPCFDRPINTYNTLRHTSSVYAMLEAWEVTREDDLKAAIERALRYIVQTLIKPVVLPSGAKAAFLLDEKDEIKLGGSGVCLLTFVKYSELTGSVEYLGLLEQIATGILHMQDATTGKFVHVLNYPSLSLKQAFRIIYYDGEAAFGLMRLYGLTGDPRWLEAVEKAFGYFIEAKHWQAHDHWLSYCVNELTRYKPLEAYYQFGIQNVAGYLDFVIERITTFPTLLELMMAAEQMVSRLQQSSELKHLLDGLDLDKFYRALHTRATYLLNGHFWPELAMFYANPARIRGSFFIRHHAFRIRIDDVEHYLSGFVAYLKYLNARQEQAPQKTISLRSHWGASEIQEATQGTWLVPPPPGWCATGLCIFAPAMQAGNVVVAKAKEGDTGVLVSVIARMRPRPAAVIASVADVKDPLGGLPVLQVADTKEAILAMGSYARAQMRGQVLAVTGSAGKTTVVAMLADALQAYGKTAHSAHNANLPPGVSWNLASMSWDTAHAVLEIAVGKMGTSARIARPHVAIFTNVQPAHLGATSTTADIARVKSMIFTGMAPGSVAVLYRDMLEWETAHNAAVNQGLTVLHFGATAQSDFQLLEYVAAGRRVRARIKGRELSYPIGSGGVHMALNSLAILAAVSALGYALEPALERLGNFTALAGRGEEFALTLDGRRLTVVDHAYNANPGSMRAALEHLRDMKDARRRVAVLGEMKELGPQEQLLHTRLAALVEGCAIDRVYVMGSLYADFWEGLPASRRGRFTKSLDELKRALHEDLVDQDVVLLKGSNSTGIHQVVAWMKETAEKQSAVAASEQR